jgi:hypothetical protein
MNMNERSINSIEPLLKNRAAGARHLSSNAYIHHYDEGPAEKLDAWVTEYMAQTEQCTPRELQAWISKISKAKNSKLGQILNHEESRSYLEALREFRPHYNVDNIFSMNFCVDVLHDISGGVSTSCRIYVMCKLIDILSYWFVR